MLWPPLNFNKKWDNVAVASLTSSWLVCSGVTSRWYFGSQPGVLRQIPLRDARSDRPCGCQKPRPYITQPVCTRVESSLRTGHAHSEPAISWRLRPLRRGVGSTSGSSGPIEILVPFSYLVCESIGPFRDGIGCALIEDHAQMPDVRHL